MFKIRIQSEISFSINKSCRNETDAAFFVDTNAIISF